MALHLPLEIKLPEYKTSPFFFFIATLSPVNKLSLTSTSPSTTLQSAQICLPVVNKIISSITTSSTGMSIVCPSLITDAVGAETKLIFSIVFLALISWIIPITILLKIIARNNKLVQAPTAIKAPATKKHNILKKVKMLPKKMLL